MGGGLATIESAADLVSRESVRGATWSAVTLAKAVISASEKGEVDCGSVDRVASLIVGANPGMASLANLALFIRGSCMRGSSIDEGARLFIYYVNEARERLVENSKEVLSAAGSVATISYSSAVEASLLASRPGRIVVFESTPGGEARHLARHLRSSGLWVELYPDSLMWVVEQVDAVLVGADTVTLDGCLYNKAGTRTLALVAKSLGKPVVAVFESYKIHPTARCGGVEVPVRAYRVEGWGDVSYRLFDEVDGSLVQLAVTENRVSEFTPENIEREAEELRSWSL